MTNDSKAAVGSGGELHQPPLEDGSRMTTAQGRPVGDGQNSMKAGERGPTLLEDFVLREKIFHFDHERIPERVVHARGYGAHGTLETLEAIPELTEAAPFQVKGTKTDAFVRFSTVAGNLGSADLARDVRGFAVKLYTTEGNWDIVGNNMPVFFIQDAMKFPDLVHAVKEEPDRGFPQAQSAHDTFWDFASLMPESTHMLLWHMSDRSLPRSFRFMEGFGVHTFVFVNANGEETFVKFHWKPVAGLQSVIWDEAVKINGADPDFHRRDLFEAIQRGDYPQWNLAVQVFDHKFAQDFDFDVLDATKLVPEELCPPRVIARLTLDRTVDSVFAETEQVAFCTQNIIRGVEFSDDPLLQGRNFSYLDTQLSRLGSSNFTQLPVNAPRCPVEHFQRDGAMQTSAQKGRVAYEPSSLTGSADEPRAEATEPVRRRPAAGTNARSRPASFADHYSQARQFYRSQTDIERGHIVAAFAFELGKCESTEVRQRVVANLRNVSGELAEAVATQLGMELPKASAPAVEPRDDLAPSRALSIIENGPTTFAGRKIGVLVSEGTDARFIADLQSRCHAENVVVELVGPNATAVTASDGTALAVDHAVVGAPSVLFDAIALAPVDGAVADLARSASVRDFVTDAFAHRKFIACCRGAEDLLDLVAVANDDGVVSVDDSWDQFLEVLPRLRFWDREIGE